MSEGAAHAARDATYLRAHLGVRLDRLGDDAVRGAIPLWSRTRTSDGQVSLGALATMIDVAALFGSRAAQASPQVTTHLALRLPAPPTGEWLYGEATVLRAGRAAVVSLVHVTDDDGRVVGVATVTSGALGGSGGSHRFGNKRADDFYSPSTVAGDGPAIDELLGLEAAVIDGQRGYRMAFHETLRNVNGVLHGGGGALVVEQAGRHAVGDAGLSSVTVDSLDIHYVAPGLVGPFFAGIEAVGAGSGRWNVAVKVVDEGRDRRLIAAGLVGLNAHLDQED